jgi:hypothetical protein
MEPKVSLSCSPLFLFSARRIQSMPFHQCSISYHVPFQGQELLESLQTQLVGPPFVGYPQLPIPYIRGYSPYVRAVCFICDPQT